MTVLERPTAPLPQHRSFVDRLGPDDDTAPIGPNLAVHHSIDGPDLPATRDVDADPGGPARRVARGALLLGVVLVTAGMALSLPRLLASAPNGDGSASRLEAASGPTASASLLRSDDRLGLVDGASASGQAQQTPASSGLVVSGGEPPGSGTAVTSTTLASSTTAWVEPTLPPPSDWIDSGNGVLVPDLLLRIRFCESTNDYEAANNWSSARGAYQFLTKSWEWYGHAERTGVAQAHLATPAQQDEAALRTLQSEGTNPWIESRPCWNDPHLDPRYATAVPPVRTTSPPRTTSPKTTATTTATGSTDTTTTGGTETTAVTGTTVPGSSTVTTAASTSSSAPSTTMSPSSTTSTPPTTGT